jgi:hypothetical protein
VVTITGLWLPILLSAVVVFFASSLLHMVLKLHKNDYKKLPNEDLILDAMRKDSLAPGMYMFPFHTDSGATKSPEFNEKCKRGPVGIVSVMPSGAINMGKYLGMWFGFCLLVGIFVAYLTSRTIPAGSDYLMVFRVAGTVAFIAHGMGNIVDSIWRAQPWCVTVRSLFDALIYALLTAGVFGWLWVR